MKNHEELRQRIKPLVWRKNPTIDGRELYYSNETGLEGCQQFSIDTYEGDYSLYLPDNESPFVDTFHTLDLAKEAAQKHYEDAILKTFFTT